MFKIIKSDRRYNGYNHFKYIVDVRRTGEYGENVFNYNLMRDWCIATWGSSCELDDWQTLNHLYKEHKINQNWCWQTEHGNRRIYLRTDKEANWFKLKYGN